MGKMGKGEALLLLRLIIIWATLAQKHQKDYPFTIH